MKGVIFAELIRWVEQTYLPAIADAMIERSGVAENGVYTSVGNYPHEDAIKMIVTLSEISGETIPTTATAYGYWLAYRFVELYPEMFEGYTDTVTFLKDVDGKMHREARKLYPDAKAPSVTAEIDGESVTLLYSSHRLMADVAYGLVRGYISYFDDRLDVVRAPGDEGSHAARFLIVAADAARG